MKVIDLLNKIANNEEVPKTIKFDGELFNFDKNYRRYVDENDRLLGERTCLDAWLNDEIEIIEKKPKKIEEIPFNNGMKGYEDIYHELENYNYRINDLIRAVNYLLEKERN